VEDTINLVQKVMEEKIERIRSNWGSVFGNVPQLPSVQRVNVGDIIKTNRYKYMKTHWTPPNLTPASVHGWIKGGRRRAFGIDELGAGQVYLSHIGGCTPDHVI
jgi:hypothetical protein